MKPLTTLLAFALLAFSFSARAQPPTGASVTGTLHDDGGEPLGFANVIVHVAADSSVRKVEVSDDAGDFAVAGLEPGGYFVTVSYVGLPELTLPPFTLAADEVRDLGTLTLGAAPAELETATVTAQRSIVEIKADRTVFNVEGTINSTGGDGMSLLRKAPGVVVDNQNNIIVMGRTGVLVYIDGKRSPLEGEALTAYLQGLPADQIDRIDIITNPGAKYEAEGNAGIIDIRLKKNEDFGSNGSASLTASQGEYFRGNVSATVNHREGGWNTFATGGVYDGENFNDNFFDREQNGLLINEDNPGTWAWQGGNLKLGTDYRIGDRHTVGVLFNGSYNDNGGEQTSTIEFSPLANPGAIDSLLKSSSIGDNDQFNASGNLNYRFDDAEGQTLNLDLDYGAFRNESLTRLPNQFFGPDGAMRTFVELSFDTPSDIDIYTATADYERPLLGGKLGAGSKFTKVVSDNVFQQYSVVGGEERFDADRSNRFRYDEQVTAAYVSYNRDFGPEREGGEGGPGGQPFNFTAGLRVEHTDAFGELGLYNGGATTAPVDRDYVNFFPNAGVTWKAAPQHTLALSYGRRINRPDYGNLNPFLGFASLVTFEQGNPTLQPEIVNNLELAHTFAYRYTTKLSVSRTEDQITRLIRPDDEDPRATYITWDNLAEQTVASLNVSVPAQVSKWWEVYVSATGSYTDNQAVYPDRSVVDIQAYNFNAYAQNTFTLPAELKFELSGFFSGPGVWGGTFETQAMGAVNVGVQRKFLADKLKVRLAADDVFFTNGWRGESNFAGQYFRGGGNWDSRRVSMSLTYNFGNDKVKVEQRETGLDEAAGRVGGGEGG